MQILIPDSWLREFIETNATPKQIQEALSLCGPSVERLHKKGNDYIYDIEVTTNRVDMMSVIGIARECAAILPRFGYTAKLKIKKSNSFAGKLKIATLDKVGYLNVKVNKDLCYRFSAVLIKDVKVGESPKIVRDRLELCGLRPLNSVVDISNYLMLEMGQPVHTFDYDKIEGHEIILRESKNGESLTTLDGKTHKLPGGNIAIEDGSGKLIDLCGIMGGLNSAVDKNTKNVLLFVQVYEPTRIRKTSMSLAHRTDAAVLFEKGLSVENVLPTLQKGIEMFGGTKEAVLDILNVKEETKIVKLKKLDLGVNLKFDEIKKILNSLQFKVISETEVEVPWFRKQDVNISEDLVEEVARIYGYHNLPSVLISGKFPESSYNKTFFWESNIKSALSHWGFTETYTYSLVEKDTGLKLKNPLSSEWTYLRTSLSSSHQKIILENLGRVKQLDLFEIANVYLPRKNELPLEQLHLIISSSNLNSSRLKGIVESLEIELGTKIDYVQSSDNDFVAVEINLDSVLKAATSIKTYIPISKFSPIIEDINIILNESYDSLINKIKKISSLIKQIDLIDKYENKLTLRITYHSNDKQLSSKDIEPVRMRLQENFPS